MGSINTDISGVGGLPYISIRYCDRSHDLKTSMPELSENAGPGVFKSSDGGAHCTLSDTSINTGLPNTFAYSIAIDPQAPETLYAGTGGGVFKVWTALRTGMLSGVDCRHNHRSICDQSSDSDILYAATYGFGDPTLNM